MQDITHILADLTAIDGQPMTTSRKVAARFGKDHAKVLRSIASITLGMSPAFSKANFGLASYADAQGKQRKEYVITKDGFAMLAMGFTGSEALKWKESYISAFNRMAEQIATASRVPAVTVTLHERIVAWEQLDSATYAAAQGGSSDMNKRKRALKLLRPEAALIAQEQQQELFLSLGA